ncbi:N-acetylmuramoyl-L-alanine amidase [Streptomyces beihaiensis]|uniref:N-acetylmuramoyl-L-alanine amidase n=1 Tax=Streptomyces beihaiensis TaxID=2984495 RepID=A0ABT3U0J9_9ACTN|nr:peptidoglycan recognition family protein [Streptomyces beihaiensis]MCX3062840.1 N-acetylmuramoyl-L-alanine amidase [Streptomyces beihaiensis]
MHRSTRSRPLTPRRSRAAARSAGTLAAAALVLPLLGAAPPDSAASGTSSSARLQAAFASAAAEYHVPPSVLLGVSYLQSRWDEHGGAPSVTGGYGPMHLTDARTALSRAAAAGGEASGDPRGDDARPALHLSQPVPTDAQLPARLKTLVRAARLTGLSEQELRSDPAANVAGGAALLAAAQRRLGKPLSASDDDVDDWYGAVAAFSGADDEATAATYADDVFSVIRGGERRTTDAGQRVTLSPDPDARPRQAQLDKLGLREADSSQTECPRTVSCEWVPAPYEKYGDKDGDYGNHDVADRPRDQSVDYIVVHDTEGSWETTLNLVQNPKYLGWHYTVRSSDGLIAQSMHTKDVGWHAGNWYVNAKSIGIEHEGFLAQPDSWYTEEMYRASARLVKYLAAKYDIPLNRQHILGHDTVPGPVTSTIRGMHTDPGPYWDWAHYFALMGHPFHRTAGPDGGLVTIDPEYATNRPAFTGCETAGEPCAPHGSSEVRLYSAPSKDAPLVKDIGLYPGGEPSTTGVNDMASRASTGQQYAVAGREGNWTAIWFLGEKAWFPNPPGKPVAVSARGLVVTPKAGASEVPVYGRAYPEAAAYPKGVPVQSVSPLPYKIPAGQRYVVGERTAGEYFWATAFDTSTHKVIRGRDLYYEIQFAHRVAYVRAADVRVEPSVTP